MSVPPSLAAVTAAAIDGRARNVYYTQNQLRRLHEVLVTHASAIEAAIIADSKFSPSEAQIEYALVVGIVRHLHASINPELEIENEYRIARNKDAADATTGVGIVIIRPTKYSFLYSTLAPLSSAIAAGNVIILELENDMETIQSILRQLLTTALDPDSFTITHTPVQDESVLALAIRVTQDEIGTVDAQITSRPKNPVVAIVDRTANFEEAAAAIYNARFRFRGQSPYAPDLVLVNEFVKKDLLQALIRHSINASETMLPDESLESENGKGEGRTSVLTNLQNIIKRDAHHIITEDSRGAILDMQKRITFSICQKIDKPLLMVQSVKSVDDAIDFTNNSSTNLLAAYHFGNAKVGKYLSQFIPAQVTFINHIPVEMLVGPAAPLSKPVDLCMRYPTTLFTKATPAYISMRASSCLLLKATLCENATDRAAALRSIYASTVTALPPQRRRKQTTASFGFFEQAFLMHFGLVIMTATSTVGAIWWLIRHREWQITR